MPTSTVLYKGELRTECTHELSQNLILTDAPRDNHGKGEAFSPTDLVATALGACMLSIMGIAANARGWDISGAKAFVDKIMSKEPPRRIVEIGVRLEMPTRTLNDSDKKILEATALACPVAKSLHADLTQNISFVWI